MVESREFYKMVSRVYFSHYCGTHITAACCSYKFYVIYDITFFSVKLKGNDFMVKQSTHAVVTTCSGS